MDNQNKFLLDDNQIKEVIKELSKKVEKYYIFPEIGEKVSQYLLNKLDQGSYNGIKDPVSFERVVSNDMVEVSNDKHFYFEYDPSMVQTLLEEMKNNDNDFEDYYIEIKKNLKSEQYRNFHILKVERLPGNIGYIKLNDFPPAEFAGDIIIGAFQFLANSYAFIFDIRNNGGGYPSLVALIVSHLIEPSSQLLTSIYDRKADRLFQNWTVPYIPGKRFPNIPVYVLTSRRTASAAEEFAYVLKMMKRATIVGETTRGAANPVDIIPILDKFVIWLPIGTPTNPISKENWEAKGVSPDYEIPQEKALVKAHMLAFDIISKNINEKEIQRMLQFEYEYCEAFYNPIKVDLKLIKEYEGKFEQYKIIVIDNIAYLERANLRHPIITKDNKTFFINEAIKFWFDEENNEKILIIERRDFPTRLKLTRVKNT
ncbi:MAG: S41 family peptidase [Candidatus Thorarchaeota archaeon]